MGVEGDALNIIKSFLTDRMQRVVLDGQVSDWVPIEAGVPPRLNPWPVAIPSLHK